MVAQMGMDNSLLIRIHVVISDWTADHADVLLLCLRGKIAAKGTRRGILYIN